MDTKVRIQKIKRQSLRNQTVNRKNLLYAIIATLLLVITVSQIGQAITRGLWQLAIEVVSELIALAIAEKIKELG
jgi:hypothetical protein